MSAPSVVFLAPTPGLVGSATVCHALRAAGVTVHQSDPRERQGALFVDDVLSAPMPKTRVDAIMLSLLHVRDWLHVARLLRECGVEPVASRRLDSDPLVVFGGASCLTPEPIAELADVIVCGDGDTMAPRLAHLAARGKRHALDACRDLPVYIPARGPYRVPRIVETPPGVAIVSRPRLVTVEASRGCRRRCVFCTMGWSGGSYRKPASLPEVRPGWSVNWAGTDSGEDGSQALGGRQRNSTVARAAGGLLNVGIEGVSARLRAAVCKPLSQETILADLRGARARHWYIIAGLPGETDSDWQELDALLDAARAVYRGGLRISLTAFQAIPHTPLQFYGNRYSDVTAARVRRIHDRLAAEWKRGDAQWLLSAHLGREQHEHDSALRRAGRDATPYLLGARVSHVHSARWRESGDWWERALEPLNRDGSAYPWEHVDCGYPRGALLTARDAYARRAVA